MRSFDKEKAREKVLDHLCRCPDGRDSVSSIVAMLRDPVPGTRRVALGPVPNFPTRHGDAADALRDLGFTIVEVQRKTPGRGAPIRWDVTV